MNYKSLNITIIIFIACLLAPFSLFGQETHFSQVNNTPILNNPANVGVLDHDLRIVNNYRSQWTKINIPYKTLHFGIDKKFNVYKQSFGIGFDILSDLASSNIMASNKFSLSASYIRFYKNHQFVIGAQYAYVIKDNSKSVLTFGEQWDDVQEVFNSNLASGENGLINELGFNDIGLGVVWKSKLKGLKPLAGISVHHLNTPSISFFEDDNDFDLPVRLTLHGQVLLPLIEKFDITPLVYYGNMKGSHDLVGGTILGYNADFLNTRIERVYGLSLVRINPVRNIDALIVGGGIEFFNVDIGISYDFNISALRKATRYQGAFEISLVFKRGRTQQTSSSEPCYML